MKRSLALLLVLSILLCGCASAQPQSQTQYTATFLTLFDTITTMVGHAESEEAFKQRAQAIHDELMVYHQLFDIYNDYEGLNNIKTINDRAGIEPVAVDSAIIQLLSDCADYYALTDGKVNVAMGSVLRLWHEARTDGIQDPENARLPDAAALEEAAKHCSFDSVVIDPAASTVFLTDSEAALDVGAVAKGWAAQRVSQLLPEGGTAGGGERPPGNADQRGRQCLRYRPQAGRESLGDRRPEPRRRRQPAHHLCDPGRGCHQRRLPASLHRGRQAVSPHHRSGYPDALRLLSQCDGCVPGFRAGGCPVHGAVPSSSGGGEKTGRKMRSGCTLG